MKTATVIKNAVGLCFLFGMAVTETADGDQGDPATARAGADERHIIESLPYLQGSKPAPSKSGVIRYDKKKAYRGLNFFISGAVPGADLIDMEGNQLHRWRVAPSEIGLPEESHCRRAHLFPNGSLLGIFEGDGDTSGPLVKLDRDSRLLWIYRGKCHHDLFMAKDGLIYVLTHQERTEYPPQLLTGPILEDFISVLSPQGKEIKKVSLIKCFLNSPYAYAMTYAYTRGDIFHTNTIEILDGRLEKRVPIFKKGRALISIRNLSIIALVDLEQESVCWLLWGMWEAQHQPTVLENGNLLLFDNSISNGRSKVIEFNPLTQEILWAYGGKDNDAFYSEKIGSNQRLPNGNTLITESETGRAFEVTGNNEIVWEFLNPHRAGGDGGLIATLYELIRLDPGYLTFLPQ